MSKDSIQGLLIDQLLSTPAGKKLKQVMEVIASVQRHIYALSDSQDDANLTLLKIGTVFQIFFIDTLASGKKAEEFTKEDWLNIAKKVSKYAILEDGQRYSEFVFTLYADYIDLSADCLPGEFKDKQSAELCEKQRDEIKELAKSIRCNAEMLQKGKITEVTYIEGCLWLSLEGMIKLLSSSLLSVIGPEYTQLAQAISQLAFEYGRYVLFAREQALLDAYTKNQYVLDDRLQQQYEAFLKDLQKNADCFKELVDEAFSPDLPNVLMRSAALARAAGVKEEELLTTMDEIDAFFMD